MEEGWLGLGDFFNHEWNEFHEWEVGWRLQLRWIGFWLQMCGSTKSQSCLLVRGFPFFDMVFSFVIARSRRGREVLPKPLEVGFVGVGFMRFSGVASSRR